MLTIFYLYKVLCSVLFFLCPLILVVNCLQFFIFTRFFAVFTFDSVALEMLWIAYNFLSLQGSLQSKGNLMLNCPCCELLTIFYLYKVLCSKYVSNILLVFVVNCLQFFIFTRFFAVRLKEQFTTEQLWIAYNFLSLQGSLQFGILIFDLKSCCELLTIFYLYKVLCSWQSIEVIFCIVVNCLQFFIFTRFFAVYQNYGASANWLWIAYNFLSLQGSLQSFTNLTLSRKRCELLTIFYLYKVLCSLTF
mgnify:CR=1 FL=1